MSAESAVQKCRHCDRKVTLVKRPGGMNGGCTWVGSCPKCQVTYRIKASS